MVLRLRRPLPPELDFSSLSLLRRAVAFIGGNHHQFLPFIRTPRLLGFEFRSAWLRFLPSLASGSVVRHAGFALLHHRHRGGPGSVIVAAAAELSYHRLYSAVIRAVDIPVSAVIVGRTCCLRMRRKVIDFIVMAGQNQPDASLSLSFIT